jgi:membrane associated rhomboid family serine protease
LTFLESTGQTDRLNRAIAVQGAGTGVMFGSMLSGNAYLTPVALLGAAVGVGYHARAIRCPRCGYNLSWHAVNKIGLTASNTWLRTVKGCPQCHLGNEDTPTGAPEQVAVEPGAAPHATAGLVAAGPAAGGVPLPPGAFAEPPPDAPWRLTLGAAGKPGGSGYVENGRMVGCARDELLRRFDGAVPPLVVWTPETPRLAWFQDVPELMGRYRVARVAAARYGHWGPLAFLLAVLVGMLTSGEPVRLGSGPAFWLAASALLLAVRLHARRSTRRLDAASVRAELDDARHIGWLRGQRARLTQVLAACMVVVFVAQLFVSLPRSFPMAGMLPGAVLRDGEWWRLLTYGVLHGNVVHIGLNLLAFWSLGQLMEVHGNRALLSPVLLAGIAGGGLAGLVLGPGVPMVGVSGGLLGLIGFLTVVGFRRRDRVPHGFAASMLKDVAFIAAVGLVGFRFIANAGHLGGLLAGLALGALLVPRPGREPRVGWAVGPVMAAIGWICAAVLVATCAATVYLVVTSR